MSNDNFWLGVMLATLFRKKQNNGNQSKNGCLSSILGWTIIIILISIITAVRKPVARAFIKIRFTFILHPVISWSVVVAVLLLIAFVIRNIKKNKKAKLIKDESEKNPEDVKSDSVEE